MPGRALDLLERDSKQVLVDLEDRGHNDRHREVLLDEHIIQVQSLLDVLAVVVAVVPKIELAIEGKALLLVLLLLQREEDVAFLFANWSKLGIEVIEELWKELSVRCLELIWECTHVLDTLSRLDHLRLGDIVCPSLVAQQ